MKYLTTKLILTLFLLGAFSSCEDDPNDLPKLKINIFGYASGEFTPSLPTFDDAAKLSLKISDPQTGAITSEKVFDIAKGSGQLPALDFAENIRLNVDVVDGAGVVLASGATPIFDFTPELSARDFRVQVQRVKTFAPYGSVVIDRATNGRKYDQSVFDYRSESKSWLGRIGHQSALLSDGRVLVVGGGDPIAGSSAGGTPSFRNLYDDVQIFDPETGYFSNLDYNDATGERAGTEKLSAPVVFHTLSAIGDDRFIVVGGYTKKVDQLRPVNTIHVIDMNKPVGERVKLMLANDGSSVTLLRGRAYHSATYRASDKKLIIAGGIGPASTTEALKTFEIIDVETQSAGEDTFDLQAPRARHAATLLADGTIWLSGGLHEDNVIRTTESISGDSSTEEGKMEIGRFGHAAFIPKGNVGLLTVVGGFTNTDGTATSTYEFAKLGRGDFSSDTSWNLPDKRGGIDFIELANGEVLLFGGANKGEDTRDDVVRLNFKGLAESSPFETATEGKGIDERFQPSVTMLTSGRILVIGGSSLLDGNAAALDSAEVYNP